MRSTNLGSDIPVGRDLYVCPVGSTTGQKDPLPFKLGTMCDSALWNSDTDMLSAVMDGKLVVWYYPNVVFVDRDLVNLVGTILWMYLVVHSFRQHASDCLACVSCLACVLRNARTKHLQDVWDCGKDPDAEQCDCRASMSCLVVTFALRRQSLSRTRRTSARILRSHTSMAHT